LERAFGMTDYDEIAAQLADADANPNVNSILLHIDSPGGTITGLPELAAKIREVSKPVVAYTEGTAASAAYWVASQADNVLLSESAEVGSIGVYVALLDQSAALEERLQANVTKWHDRFKADVNIKRDVPESSMTGQTYEGLEAIEAGLADAVVNDLNDVISLMVNL
jgi:ClpP class serine protease